MRKAITFKWHYPDDGPCAKAIKKILKDQQAHEKAMQEVIEGRVKSFRKRSKKSLRVRSKPDKHSS